jgi:WD40 repeat protein
VAFVGESEQMLASSGDQNIRLHEMDERRPVRGFGGSADFVYAAAATPDGRLVVAGGDDSVLRIWNGADGKELRALAPPE